MCLGDRFVSTTQCSPHGVGLAPDYGGHGASVTINTCGIQGIEIGVNGWTHITIECVNRDLDGKDGISLLHSL